jgi:SAM-dependent methyltransferase
MDATTTPNGGCLERAHPYVREALAPLTVRNGILDALGADFQLTSGQRSLDSRLAAWGYELLRERFLEGRFIPAFAAELQNVVDRLALKPGDTVLDLACGQGNFTVELARRVGPNGLVIGVDTSLAMLNRAVQRRKRSGCENVLLIRGDALDLPLRSGVLDRINCAGGLHLFPDLDRATAELRRVSRPGARLALSGFAQPERSAPSGSLLQRMLRRYEMDVISLTELGVRLERLGFGDVDWEMGGRAIGYIWARLGPQRADTATLPGPSS